MERIFNCGLTYRSIFLLLAAMSLACLVFQYRFNYASISQCFTRKPSGYVTTRVVERVYFEMPNSPTPGLSTAMTWAKARTSSPTTEPSTEKPICKPKNKIVFLKTHKTGSSTITNILNRYADWNNLTMLLPKDEAYYSFNWPNKFRLSYAKDTHGRMPDILANHARYSQKSLNVLFPRETTTYITILRDPVKQWESMFSYMSFPYILNIHKKKDALDFFLKNPPSVGNIKRNALRFPSIYLIKNPLFFDLGLDYKHYSNATMIKRAIQALDNDFNLVLMMEHFDESMVLLKRRMCWSTDDVVFFKTNERLNKNKRRVLTAFQQDSIKAWNPADAALYEYFAEKFWKEIEKEGSDFYDDLEELRARKKYYFEQCIEKEAITEAYSSVYVKGYEMRKNLTEHLKLFCERMLRNELSYQDYFKDRYIERLNDLEGETIENFENQLQEAEIDVEVNDSWGEEGTSYDYGLPTKKPRPPPSKVTILKTRVQKQKDRAAAAALKAKREADRKKAQEKASQAKGNIVRESEGSGAIIKNRKNINKGSEGSGAGLKNSRGTSRGVNKSAKGSVKGIDIEKETSGLKKINSNNTTAVKGKSHDGVNSKNSRRGDKNAYFSGSGEKVEKAEKSNGKLSPKQTVFTAAVIPEAHSKENLVTKRLRKELETTLPSQSTAELTLLPTAATNPITLEEKLTTLAKRIYDLDKSTGPPEMTSEYIRYSKDNKLGQPMESANKILKKDDRRRYDGKTIIKGKN